MNKKSVLPKKQWASQQLALRIAKVFGCKDAALIRKAAAEIRAYRREERETN